jgi:cellulose synthase/poly-beta-1,6-N-acetylglucosamine synthase-like glycosyltransferase
MMETIFFLSLFFLLYPTIGYPLALVLIYPFRHFSVARKPYPGKVSIIITAHNEEKLIEKKLKNTLDQDFPQERLEILVASDFSTDATDTIVDQYAERGVFLVRPDRRGGKEYAQTFAVARATGDVIIFSDVGTELDMHGIAQIASNFSDDRVGCVSSRDVFISPGQKVSGEGMYVRYEMFVRRLESRVNSLVGLSGSFFAARADVCAGIRSDTQSDFQTLLNAVRLGYLGILDPDAVGYYRELVAPHNELRRKMRTVLRGITTLMNNADVMNPMKNGLFSFQIFSHKLLRWEVPLFLLLMLISSAVGSADNAFLALMFVLQTAGYGLALSSILSAKLSRFGPMQLIRYAMISNIGIIMAWLKYFQGERIVYWEPSKR